MADTKISAETAAGTLDGTEIVPVVKAGANRRTTTQDIAGLTGLTLISTQVASGSANLAFTGLDSSTNRYKLILDRLIAASGDTLILEFGTGAGPTYETSGYRYVQPFWGTSTGEGVANKSEAAASLSLAGLTTTIGIIGEFLLSGAMCVGITHSLSGDTHDYFSNIGGRWTGGASFTALRLRLSGGANIATGSASLYKIN